MERHSLPDRILGKWEDVLPGLPDGLFDLIYQDPPYGMEYCSGIPGSPVWNKSGETRSRFDAPMFGDKHGDVDWERLANECYRVLKDDRFLFLHCNLDVVVHFVRAFQYAGFNIKGMVTWNKRFAIGGDLNSTMKREAEPIIYMAKGSPRFNPVRVWRGKGKKSTLVERKRISEVADWVFKMPKDEKCGFPTQKPIELCKQVIRLTTDPGGLVLDPFGGSGSIAVAAKMLGRRFVTIEVDSKTFEILYTRLDNTPECK